MPIRIAYALPGTDLSGGVKVVLEQIVRLNRCPGLEAVAVAQGSHPSWFDGSALPLIHADPLDFDYSSYDILVTTFYTQGELWRRWAHKARLHFCQGFEGDYAEDMGKLDELPVIDRFYRNAAVVATVTRSLQRRLQRFGGRVVYLGQGLDPRRFHPGTDLEPALDPSLLIVGALDLPFKGVAAALGVAREVKRRRPAVRIRRVSPTDTRSREEALCPIDDYRVAVAAAEMPDLYRGSGLLLYLPRREGFGLPLIEAMACGTPVIATAIAPFREICGRRYPLVATSDPGSLADQALTVLDHPDHARRLRREGLAIAGRFRYHRVLFRLIPLLLTLIVRAGGRRRGNRSPSGVIHDRS